MYHQEWMLDLPHAGTHSRGKGEYTEAVNRRMILLPLWNRPPLPACPCPSSVPDRPLTYQLWPPHFPAHYPTVTPSLLSY